MSSNSSIVDRLMGRGFDQKGLQLNFMYVIFLAVALGLVGFLAYSGYSDTQYGSFIVKALTILAAVFAGVAGHLLQGPFAVFSVVLFLALYNFFAAHYKHFTTATSPAIVAAMKESAELLFWVLAFFGLLYLVFVYFPQINALIPTADEAYRLMKRRPTMSAPKAAAAPTPSA